MFAKKKNKKRPIVLMAVLVLLALLGAAVYWAAGTLELELRVKGEQKITLEYESEYFDAGAEAILKSTFFEEKILEIPIAVINEVNTDVVGAYGIAYYAEFLWLNTAALRIVEVVDTQAPILTLVENPDSFTLPGDSYAEDGFSAYDDYDGDITHLVERSLKENVMTYMVVDSSGNHTMAQRIIRFDDPVPPELTLLGGTEVTVYLGRSYQDPGYTATDNFDTDITDKVVVEGSVDPYTLGTYTITYTVTDTFGNTTSVTRTVTVEPVPQPETVIPEGKVIYLTFDDGPSQYTPRLLEILKKYNVKATFFVVNTKYINLISDIVADGHAIGVHTGTHIYEDIYASEEAFFQDFKTVHDLIYQMTGVKTTLMRFPGGSSNKVSSFNEGIMTRLTKLVTDYGLQYFDWNVNSLDAANAKTADQVYHNTISGIMGHQYSVVLQHDIHGYSVDAVERIIQWGLANGYTFLSLDPTSPNCHQTILN